MLYWSELDVGQYTVLLSNVSISWQTIMQTDLNAVYERNSLSFTQRGSCLLSHSRCRLLISSTLISSITDKQHVKMMGLSGLVLVLRGGNI